MSRLTPLGVHQWLAWRMARLPSARAPVIGMLVHRSPDPDMAAASAGQALQRAWLAAARVGLAFQPFTAASALLRQPVAGDRAGQRSRERLVAGLAQLGDGRPESVFAFFRLGHARPSAVRASRPDIRDFL
jgi:hypothetical protein